MLKDAHVRAGSILLLSDGADTSSKLSQADVLAAARAAGIRIFTIGLRSGSFDSRALAQLADGTHADYAQARNSSDLTAIYAALGRRLANEYLIRYRSLASRGVTVRVEVAVAGVSKPVTSDYVTPPLSGKQLQASGAKGFWGSALSMILVSFLCAFLIGLAVVAVLARRPRPETVSDRLKGFVSAAPEEAPSQTTLTGRMLGEADRSLGQTSWWPTFKEELEIARIELPAIQVVTLTALATIVVMFLLLTVTGSPLAALVAFGIPPAVRAAVTHRVEQQRRLFSEQLADNLQVIASACVPATASPARCRWQSTTRRSRRRLSWRGWWRTSGSVFRSRTRSRWSPAGCTTTICARRCSWRRSSERPGGCGGDRPRRRHDPRASRAAAHRPHADSAGEVVALGRDPPAGRATGGHFGDQPGISGTAVHHSDRAVAAAGRRGDGDCGSLVIRRIVDFDV